MSQDATGGQEEVLGKKNSPRQDEPGADGSRTPQEVAQVLAAWRESLLSVKRSIDEATKAVSTLRGTLLEMAPLWRSLGELEQALKSLQWEELPPTTGPVAVAEAEESAPVAPAVEEPPVAPQEPVAEAAPAAEAEAVAPEAPAAEPEAPVVEAEPVPEAEPVAAEVLPPEPEEPVPPAEAVAEEPAPEREREPAAAGAFSSPRRPLAGEGVEKELAALHSYTITVEDPGAEAPLVPLYRALGRVGRIRDMDLVSYTNGVAVISVQSDEEIAGDDLQVAIEDALERGCRVVNHERNVFLVRLEPS